MRKNKKDIIANKWLIPLLHIVIAIFWKMYDYHYEELDFLPVYAVNQNMISDMGETVLNTFISWGIGCIIIFLFWKLVFDFIEKRDKRILLVLGSAFILTLLIYPYNFSVEPDNYMTFAYSVRNISEYWQSVYQGCIYSACLLLFPQPAVITFVQLSSFLGCIVFVTGRLKALYGRIGYITYSVLLFPEAYRVATNPYRNCMNTIGYMWLFSVVVLGCLEHRKIFLKQQIILLAAGAFLSVYRSEGILLWIILFCLIWWNDKGTFYKKIGLVALGCVFYIILLLPQKAGEVKYYGNDYTMINEMNVLQAVLTSEEVNLDYDTVLEDMEKIQTIVPLEYLLTNGINGYRLWNYTNKGTVNQSLATKQEKQEFIKAARNLERHNIKLVVRYKWNTYCSSNGYEKNYLYREFNDEMNAMITKLGTQSDSGWYDMLGDSFPKGFFCNTLKLNVSLKIMEITDQYDAWVNKTWIRFIYRNMMYLAFLILCIWQSVMEKKNRMLWVGTLMTVGGMWGAVFLAAPEGRSEYYYPIFMVTFLVNIILGIKLFREQKNVTK